MAIPLKKKPAPKPENDNEEAPKGKGKSFAQLFKETKPQEGQNNPPDGVYQVLWVDGGYLKKQGALSESVFIDMVIVNDELEGRKVRKFFQIFNDEGEPSFGLGSLKADLETLGLDELEVESVEDLGEQLSQVGADDLWFEVNLKTGKRGYQNVYINKMFEDQDEKPQRPPL